MLTRREVLSGLTAALLLRTRTCLAKAAQPVTPVNFEVPAGACDCHTHIFADPGKFPLFAGRGYTPETAEPDEMTAFHRALHVQRVVIVTASIYGTDNSTTLYGMKARGHDARGIAVIDERTPETELDAMNRAGVRGIRLNFGSSGVNNPAVGRQRFHTAVNRIKRLGWHIQVATNLAMISALQDVIMASPVPVVVDHFGRARAELGPEQPGFSDLVDLVRSGKVYVKISAGYSISRRPPDYPDIVPIAQALIAANPDRIVWGTDWPHPNPAPPPGGKATDVSPLIQIDDGHMLNLLPVWAPDPAIRKRVLVSNPAELYGF
jgi:predicted TIM-barrel fold metal-dependent hydrolase